MADLRLAIPIDGADFDTDCAEHKRSNTEVSLKASGESNVSNSSIMSVDTTTLTGWTETNSGTGDSSIENNEFKLYSGTDYTIISRDYGSISTASPLVVTLRAYLPSTLNDATSSVRRLTLSMYDGTKRILINFAIGNIFVNAGTPTQTGATYVEDDYNLVTLEINYDSGISNWKLSKVFVNGIDAEITPIACAITAGGTNGTFELICRQNVTPATVYVSRLDAGIDYSGLSYPTEGTVNPLQVDSGSNATVWDMSTFLTLVNPNGESGTVKFKYATDDTGNTIPDYADDNTAYSSTWLTLAQLQAETDQTAGCFRIVMQITGNGSQDGTVTDSSIVATITTTGGSQLISFGNMG